MIFATRSRLKAYLGVRLNGLQTADCRLPTAHWPPASAHVAFMVYWYDEKQDKEVLVVLPEVRFLRGKV